MESLGPQEMRKIVSRVAALMVEKKDELIRLDGAMGDGDLGLTMEKGFLAASQEAEKGAEKDVGTMLMKIGMAIARVAPSTMGTLVGSGFLSGGNAVTGRSSLGVADLALFFASFTTGVMQRGKSGPGEKTLVDVLVPASQALTDAAAAGASLVDALGRMKQGAERGLAASRAMVAQHGRQAYYQEKSRGREDPGAVAVMFILQGFWDHAGVPG
jgi:phosphoenolpyruvate---glycerone phosphotransferase subunit DhaL